MGPIVIVVPALFLMIAYVFYVVATAITQRQQLRSTTEFQAKLLDRMGSLQELREFVNTEGGQRLLGAGAGSLAGGTAHNRVLRAFQSGIVLVCLGIGIFFYLSEVRVDAETYEVIGFVGTVSTAVGIGVLLSGLVSLRLSRKLGLINGTHTASPKDLARPA